MGAEASTFGELLRRHRQAARLTQEELAERAGLSVRSIAGLEIGERRAPRRDTVQLLAEALGLSGSDREELQAAARGHKVSPAPQEESRSPAHNLPPQLTSFIGREREVEEVRRTLSTTRLLTLTGPGGSGKTRLALAVTSGIVGQYADGVWLVDLASLSDPELVPRAVAQVLEVREAQGRQLTSTIAEALRPREMLLILDSCEHLIDACAHLVDTLLRSCPELRVLGSSREALGVAGEATWHVSPLSVPGPGRSVSPETALHFEAVRLFVERARSRQPAFALTLRNCPAVLEICRRLDGLPLAIELSAARADVLTPDQIAVRLDTSLRLLRGVTRTAPPRQQTLRASLDWSYDLLDEPERQLFSRTSVFAGGWTLEAAEAIGAGRDVLPEEVLDLLSRLVHKSLVVADPEAEGARRYRLLEPVREYARERLEESGDADSTRRRHAEHYLELGERAEPEMVGEHQVWWLGRLQAEHDNLRAALGWLLGRGEAETALRLVMAIWRFWQMRGYLGEGRLWLERGLSSGARLSPSLRARALNIAGFFAWRQGDYAKAAPLLQEAVALRRDLGDERGVAASLDNLGLVLVDRGEFEQGRALLEEGLRLRQQLGHEWGIALSLNDLAYSALLEGDYERARVHSEESAARFRELGSTWGTALAVNSVGCAVMEQGDHERALELLSESLALSWQVGERRLIADCLDGLATVAGQQGLAERAARLFGAAEALRKAVGAPLSSVERLHHERHLAAPRAQLGEEAFAALLREGREMEPERVLEYALSGSEIAEGSRAVDIGGQGS